jgi:hypothetical protein
MAITWTRQFFINKNDLSSIGKNPYFILQPGYRLVFRGREAGKRLMATITVLNKTKIINGVNTRIVEERDYEDGKLIEITRNYFAISKRNNSVFYFGEDVDIFDKNGKIISHTGSWRAGAKGAKAGLNIPGIALVGSRYYQEVAPKVALDRSQILSVTDSTQVPVGKFHNVLNIKETTPLEPKTVEFKHYARGIGLIKAKGIDLVKYGYI